MKKIGHLFKSYGLAKMIKEYVRTLKFGVQDIRGGSSSSRLFKAGLSTFALGLAKGFQFLITLVSVPIVLRYLGKADYGMVVTVASIVGWLAIGDFGIGLGVKNALIDAYARDDKSMAKSYVSTGLIALTLVALLLAAVFAVMFPFIPWASIIKVDSGEYSKLEMAIAVSALLLFLSIPLNVIRQIYSAEQKEYKNALWTMVGACLGLLVLLTTVWLDLGIVGIVFGLYGMGFVSTFGCGIHIFIKDKRWLKPSWRSFSRSAWQRIWSGGIMFFIVQLGMVGIFQSSVIIVSSFLGVSNVPDYSVPSTLFNYIGLLVSFIVSPFWAAFGDAAMQEDWHWIKKNLRRLIRVSLSASIVLSAVLILIGPQLISRWTNGAVVPSRTLLLVLGSYTTTMAYLSVHSVLLNGFNCLRIQAAVGILHALINVMLAMILVRQIGIVGVALSGFLSALLTSAWVLPLTSHRILQPKPTLDRQSDILAS